MAATWTPGEALETTPAPATNASPPKDIRPYDPAVSQIEQTVDQGDVRANKIQPGPSNGANGYLEDATGARVWLWVNNVEAAFSMSGSTAQSHRSRHFYPHNFGQPTITVTSQMPNDYERGRISEFIRAAQLRALNDDENILRLRIVGGGVNKKRNSRGAHKQIDVDGYVLRAARAHERFIVAGDYTFEIAITKARNFLDLSDRYVKRIAFESIKDTFINKRRYQYVREDGGGESGTGGGVTSEPQPEIPPFFNPNPGPGI